VVRHREGGGRHGSGQPGEHHDMVVRRIGGDGRVVARSEWLEDGERQEVAARLEPGRYEVLCAVVEEVRGHVVNHYAEGMHAVLVVTEGERGEAAAAR
jgi:hypothetical protein